MTTRKATSMRRKPLWLPWYVEAIARTYPVNPPTPIVYERLSAVDGTR
jgi:hypothetical protein